MIIVILTVLGLCLGSFVNALVYRLHEQSKASSEGKKLDKSLSITKGRSLCPNCQHELAAKDLIPVFSWLALGGKCRYCTRPISVQYPLVELLTAALFLFSYAYWPVTFNREGIVLFIFWLALLVGFMALCVYDLRWFLLPDKIIYPLVVVGILQTILIIFIFHGGIDALKDMLFGVLIGGGIFFVLFQLSRGSWIGGGDVKLGGLLGLILGRADLALFMIFAASALGSVVSIPLLVTGRAKRGTRLPFGPFLIAGAILVYLFGSSIISWYKRKLSLE